MSRLFHLFLHLLFGGVFVYAGLLKAWDPASFVMDVRSFDLVPDPYAAWVAMFLPWLEVFSGLAVITSLFRKGGLLILNTSLLAFLIAIGISWHRGIDIQCGCFGSSQASSNYLDLILRDAALLLLGLYLQLRPTRPAVLKSDA
ncbi:methylamine utilization protein MauE [Prosthecobacter fusiformis]|uniref:Methylamine utilization protein MauE n=1 Tax=Prosthecobacter fusiformis TaxID=48464 RepID=A0A4R7RR57_9BACT|nr:MauE/DoxX family redox-associated membrane protein [Prosthecobacter fusiformis]TDU67285.1 methylamine utilization protein MauE [Prosthecobacter fusiformis]